MLNLENVRKVYRTRDVETTALSNVTLQINHGEFVAIMGPSGCGKSTLLNILGMIDKPTAGTYAFDGVDLTRLPEGRLVDMRKKYLGFIFQSFNLVDELSVQDNVGLPLLYNGTSAAERREKVREVLELVGLHSRARHKPAQLSGGQQQRVAIARAVVNDPKLILADEPTGNLDTQNGAEVLDMLRVLHEHGATIVMVTHSESDASHAERRIYMRDGQIVPAPESRAREEALA